MKLREPIFEAQIIKLAEASQNPASVHGRRNHDGYICLSGGNANWQLCAKVAHSALKGRHHAVEISSYATSPNSRPFFCSRCVVPQGLSLGKSSSSLLYTRSHYLVK